MAERAEEVRYRQDEGVKRKGAGWVDKQEDEVESLRLNADTVASRGSAASCGCFWEAPDAYAESCVFLLLIKRELKPILVDKSAYKEYLNKPTSTIGLFKR